MEITKCDFVTENMPSKLPTNWMWAQLGNVANIVGGGTPRKDRSEYYSGGNILWATPTDIDPDEIKFITDTSVKITEKGLKESSARLLPKGTILFSSRASIGKIAIAGVEITTNQGFANVIPFDGIDSKFIAYGMRNFVSEIESLGSGTTFLEVAKSSLREFDFPLAPTNEQKRIVSKIEELFKESKTARQVLDKIPQIMKKFRQSVLDRAFRGELVPQDPNDDSAEKLLEKIRQERRRKWEEELRAKGKDPKKFKYEELEPVELEKLFELPKGWAWSNIEFVTENHDGKRIPVSDKERKKRKGKYPYYGASGIIDSVNNFLFNGDYLLIGEDGANLLSRNTPIAFIAKGKFWVNNHAHVLTTLGDIPLEYLESYFNSIDLSRWVTGTAQPKLNQKRMNSIPIPIAPLGEQNRISKKIQELFSFANQIEKAVEEAKKRADRIDQAILAKAFRGEMIPQDPNDEPASILLERIKQGKELEIKQTKHKSRKSK